MARQIGGTKELPEEASARTAKRVEQQIKSATARPRFEFRRVGHPTGSAEADALHGWLVRIDVLTMNSMVSFGLDVGGEVLFGRGDDSPNFVDLSAYNADTLGVSRTHMKLYPERGNLWIADAGSKFATRRNGELVEVDKPAIINDGDIVQLGILLLKVTIVGYPQVQADAHQRDGVADVMLEEHWATLRATLGMLNQPLMVVNRQGKIVVSNRAAEALWEHVRSQGAVSSDDSETLTLSALIGSLRQSVGKVNELQIGDKTYIATVEHAPNEGTVIVMQDVTPVRKIERLQMEFAQALSHDIRGPLSSIIGFAQLLRDSNLSDDEREEFLGEILRSSDRLKDMASQLVDFALLGRNSRTSMPECDFSAAVTDAAGDLKGAALAKSVQIEVNVKGDVYTIHGDMGRLYRTVLNLIDNAVKYAPENSKVEVELQYTREKITLMVRDMGPGIPEEEQAHIFEKYYRVNTTAVRRAGIGMGLALVRTTIRNHGGDVVTHNRQGGGSEFVLTLPGSLRSSLPVSKD